MKKFSSQQRKARDERPAQRLQDMVLRLLRKKPAVAEVPGLLLETALAAVPAAGNEEGHPHPFPVGYVNFLYHPVVHRYSALVMSAIVNCARFSWAASRAARFSTDSIFAQEKPSKRLARASSVHSAAGDLPAQYIATSCRRES